MGTFHDRLKKLKDNSRKTQATIAEELGITPQSFSYYLNGREPSYDQLVEFAKYFHVTTDYLLGLSDATKVENANLTENTGLSEKAIQILKLIAELKQHGSTNLSDFLNTLITDERLFTLAIDAKRLRNCMLEPKQIERLKTQLNVVLSGESDEYKKCKKMVEQAFGEGNAVIISGDDVASYYRNKLKDTFIEILENHKESTLNEMIL